MRHGYWLTIVALLTSVALPHSAFALQDQAAALTGVVRDVTGSVVGGARVTITGDNGKLVASTVTEADGRFELRLHSAGPFRVQVLRVGFQVAEKDLALISGQGVQIELQLVPTRFTDTVLVSADAPSNLSIRGGLLANLPMHHAYDVLSFGPGITRRGRDLVLRGTTRADLEFQVEGIPVRDPQTAGYLLSIARNAVDEVRFGSAVTTQGVGSAQAGIVDVRLPEPTSRRTTDLSLSLGSYDTIEGSALFSGKTKIGKTFLAATLFRSAAVALDSRLPSDFDPYTQDLKSSEIFATEHNSGRRINVVGKWVGGRDDRYSTLVVLSSEHADTPPVVHNGQSFTKDEVADLIKAGRLKEADYSSYPFGARWGGRQENTAALVAATWRSNSDRRTTAFVQPFWYLTNRSRLDHAGSWFFERGFGGGYDSRRNHQQLGVMSGLTARLGRHVWTLTGEVRHTRLDMTSIANPTVLDTYYNVRGNAYAPLPYTTSAVSDPGSPYFGWPEPDSLVKPLSERYNDTINQGTLVSSHSIRLHSRFSLEAVAKVAASSIGAGGTHVDPALRGVVTLAKGLQLTGGYARSTQWPSVYQSFKSPYDPYSWGYDASFDAEGNPAIEPELGATTEVGVVLRRSWFTASSTWYRIATSNDIATTPAPEIVPLSVDPRVAARYFQYQNRGRGASSGLEFTLATRGPYGINALLTGHAWARSDSANSTSGALAATAYDQSSALTLLVSKQFHRVSVALHGDYGSGLPFRWREVAVDGSGRVVTLVRHSFDRHVPAHTAWNSTIEVGVTERFRVGVRLVNIQGVLDPVFGWGKNKYIEFRDTDSVQNPLGIPRYGAYSLPRMQVFLRVVRF